MITIFTIAGSAVYAAEIPVSDQDQLITSSDWTEISNLQDEMKKEEPDATIDYDKALKVYVDCNLIKLQTADTKKLTSALESANYVWVIPFKMEKTYGMFTVAKGLPLSEEAKSVLTKAEQEEVKNHAGKWMITEIAEHTVEPYYDILLEKDIQKYGGKGHHDDSRGKQGPGILLCARIAHQEGGQGLVLVFGHVQIGNVHVVYNGHGLDNDKGGRGRCQQRKDNLGEYPEITAAVQHGAFVQ